MAYESFTLADKISLWQQLERRRPLGAVKSQGSGDRVATEFTNTSADLRQEIALLVDSIAHDPGFDDSNQYYDAIMGAQRPGQTKPIYVSKFNPWVEL